MADEDRSPTEQARELLLNAIGDYGERQFDGSVLGDSWQLMKQAIANLETEVRAESQQQLSRLTSEQEKAFKVGWGFGYDAGSHKDITTDDDKDYVEYLAREARR